MLFYLQVSCYRTIYFDKLNELASARIKLIKENFGTFNKWDDNDAMLKKLLEGAKERVLNNDECLIREQQAQPCIYLLISGKLRVERKVSVESVNYWPVDFSKNWVEKKVTSNVLFKISEILPMMMFGEHECIYEKANPVQIVAAAPCTKLIMIMQKDLKKGKKRTINKYLVENNLCVFLSYFSAQRERNRKNVDNGAGCVPQ